MRNIEKRLFLFGFISGLLSLIYYTYINLQNRKIFDCINTHPGICSESQFRRVIEDVLLLICPAQVIQIFSIGVNGGPLSYAIWIFTIVLNGAIFYFIGTAFRAIFDQSRPPNRLR
jgi:uncharacterized membrane protein